MYKVRKIKVDFLENFYIRDYAFVAGKPYNVYKKNGRSVGAKPYKPEDKYLLTKLLPLY